MMVPKEIQLPAPTHKGLHALGDTGNGGFIWARSENLAVSLADISF
jgi:hypothetical protein